MRGKAGLSFKAAVLLLAAAWQCNAMAASAPPLAPDVPQSTVHFYDLNLDRPADVAKLYHRIQSAAELVCGEPQLTGSRVIQPSWRRCVAQAVGRAIVTLDRPTLTAYYRVHGTALIPAS
jgi:UrcA family protein